MELPEINILAILAAALVEVVVGAIWFNAPFAFNKQWLAGIGKTAEQVREEASHMALVVAVVGAIITAFVMALFIGWMGINTLVNGLIIGFLIAVGFSANSAFIKDQFERRPMSLTLINGLHDVVIFTIMGGILAAWQV